MKILPVSVPTTSKNETLSVGTENNGSGNKCISPADVEVIMMVAKSKYDNETNIIQ